MVSIILNCYNGEQFLEETLQSISSQTYDNYEIVFVDNCSTDKSADIAKRFDKRLKYYNTDEHVTLGKARNYALDRCRGEYIAFIDSDDLWERDKLAVQVGFMEKAIDFSIVTTNYYALNMLSGKKGIGFNDKNSCKEITFDDFVINYKYALSSFLIRRNEVCRYNLRFDERLSYSEEYDFFFRLGYNSRIMYISKPLCTYRIHKNMNSRLLQDQMASEANIVLSNYLDSIQNEQVNQDITDYLTYKIDYHKAMQSMRECEPILARKFIKQHRFKGKMSLAIYILSFLPVRMGKCVFDQIRKTRF